jgi:hypothetical protein
LLRLRIAEKISNLPASVRDNLIRTAAGTRASLPLTLVTGDKVQIGVTAKRQPVVREIEPATRAGHESVVFHTVTNNGQVYVVPDDALPLLRADLLDWELFNLAKLADWAAEGRAGEVPAIETFTACFCGRYYRDPCSSRGPGHHAVPARRPEQ